MKKGILFALAGCTVFSFCASAKMLSPESALNRFRSSAGETVVQRVPASGLKLVESYSTDGINIGYVYSFGSDRGFIVLSASDKAPALLGYSDEDAFSSDEIPEAMKGWLDQCGEMILYAENNGQKVVGVPVVAGLQSIAPVTKTKWNQNSPYNDLCPLEDGEPTCTGCGATALAQVLKTYSYPETGEGIVAYQWQNQELKVDYARQHYDWSQMLDEYDATATEVQKQQVANLMFTLGVSGRMNYSKASSGAESIELAAGLVHNFKYDKGLQYLLRDYYTLDEWSRMLHAELSQGHGVYYEGHGTLGGHAFVIDGYNSEDGFFHVNWGWGGLSNGYFNLVTLEPEVQGIGGNNSGFSTHQAAVFNLRPAQTGSEYVPSVCIDTDFKTAARTYKRNQAVEILGSSASKGIIPYSIVPMEYTYGVKLTDDAGNVSYVWSEEICDKTLTHSKVMSGYTVPAAGFPEEGEFTMTPVFKCGNRIYDVKVAIRCSQAVKCTASANELKFRTIAVETNLAFSPVEFGSALHVGRPFSASVEIVNNGPEYIGKINGVIMKDYTVVALYQLGKYDIPAGATEKIQFNGDIAVTVKPGQYQFAFTIDDGTIVSDMQTIEILEAPAETVAYIKDVRFPLGDGGSGTAEDPFKVYSQTCLLEADLHCESGYFNQQVVGLLYRSSGGSYIAMLDAPVAKVDEGQTETLTFAYDISPVCSVDQTYLLLFAKSSGKEVTFLEPSPDKFWYFKVVGLKSGVENLTDEADPVAIEYFDCTGRRVENPEKGRMLLKKSTYPSGDTSVSKIIY